MANRYLVVVPVNKEAYLKGFNSMEKATAIIHEKIGSMIKENSVDCFDRQMTMFSVHARKKSSLQVNERATYYATLPSAEDDIFGMAVIIGKADDTIVGLTEKDALKVMNDINNLRVS